MTKDDEFPHKEITSAVAIGVLSYCFYSFFQILREQRKNYLELELSAEVCYILI